MDKTNLFGITEESIDSIYTTKVEIPQYLPKNICPSIYDLYSTIKYDDLKNNILKANITEDFDLKNIYYLFLCNKNIFI